MKQTQQTNILANKGILIIKRQHNNWILKIFSEVRKINQMSEVDQYFQQYSLIKTQKVHISHSTSFWK